MKWFKHDADAFLSEGVDALIDAEGFAGYGRWNRILEIVAFKMDDTNRCHAEYSIQKWCRLLGLKQKKLISFLELTENQLKTKVVYYENIIRIEIPNLLKKRDNYTKHLQVPRKQLVSKDIDKEVDRDIDKKKEKKPLAGFEDIWGRYPNKDSRGKAEKSFNKSVTTEDLFTSINKALDNYIEMLKVDTWRKPQSGSTWFNNWKDWIDYEAPKNYDPRDKFTCDDLDGEFDTIEEMKEKLAELSNKRTCAGDMK